VTGGAALAWQLGGSTVEPGGDLILLLLVLALLVEYEVLAAYLGDEGRRRLRPLLVVLMPLLPVALLVVVLRASGVR
jgi:hypothetical protein